MLAHGLTTDRTRLGAAEERQVASVEPVRPRKIIHIDMDAFYASVEQRDKSQPRGKPLAVGGSREHDANGEIAIRRRQPPSSHRQVRRSRPSTPYGRQA
jgi:hypothetical protein